MGNNTNCCPNCGASDFVPGTACEKCGFLAQEHVSYEKPVIQNETQSEKAVESHTDTPMNQTNKKNKKNKKQKKQKPPKKKVETKTKIKRLCIFLGIVGILALCWVAFINMITLSAHSNEVVDTINASSLDVPGLRNEAYNALPHYAKEYVDNPADTSSGPIVQAVLPYVHIERVRVRGFFLNSSVEYKISAPDMESWILQLDESDVKSEKAFMKSLEQYLTDAPYTERNVTVEYSKDSDGWKGNYKTPEFLDAISGGVNSAYTELYSQMLSELKEAL